MAAGRSGVAYDLHKQQITNGLMCVEFAGDAWAIPSEQCIIKYALIVSLFERRSPTFNESDLPPSTRNPFNRNDIAGVPPSEKALVHPQQKNKIWGSLTRE
jgi:hypothetical protein